MTHEERGVVRPRTSGVGVSVVQRERHSRAAQVMVARQQKAG
ncbi:rCG43002 [Rattus norvegicus]|uniref:RCG43002 n=1 Tax=Rattus norvegicus TaxID=10116 RepID=A6IW18_RAT|nr:rCG43002 [Rattus norvegicus]